VLGLKAQLPVATLAVQLLMPSLIVTLPVGAPLPGDVTPTRKLTVISWPTTDGSGRCEVIVVVVSAFLTTWGSFAELSLKLLSPA
jgi:hypothetical protein